MNKHKGFTVVELMVVVILIGILATLGGLAWRSSRNAAADSHNRAGALKLRDSLDRYYQRNGEYPANFNQLKAAQLIDDIPLDASGGDFQYRQRNLEKTSAYAIRVPQSSGTCKLGKHIQSDWFSDAPKECPF